MPVFTTLMTDAFGSEDPFGALVRNDQDNDAGDVRVLPIWVADRLEADLQNSREIAR